jgi:hypothetical protein
MPPSVQQPNKTPLPRMFWLTMFSIGLFFLLMVVFITFLFIASFRAPNAGQHTGYITSVEESGYIWKTWTAYVKTDPQSSQEDRYCVIDPSVVNALQSAAIGKTPVTLYYSISAVTWKWQCDGEPSIIRSVSTSSVVSKQ